jgi:hypothetical protein
MNLSNMVKKEDIERVSKELADSMSKHLGREVTIKEALEFVQSDTMNREVERVHKDLISWLKKVNAMMLESCSNPELQLLKIMILNDLFKKAEKRFKDKDEVGYYKSARETVNSFYKSVDAKAIESKAEDLKKRLYE